MGELIVPNSRPKRGEADVVSVLKNHDVDINRPALLGVRGYYLKTFGDPNSNDIGVYDDAIFLCAPHCFISYNANTDPGAHSPGVATLKPGKYIYKLGIHGLNKPTYKQYEALIQASLVTVTRDGEEGEFTSFFGINIHRGSMKSVSSLGCQTIYPSQWDSFITTVKLQLSYSRLRTIPYVLIDQLETGWNS